MPKRIVVWVQFKDDRWRVVRDNIVLHTARTKMESAHYARQLCRDLHASGQLVQLKIRNQNGRIGTEATYGSDPKRYAS